MGCGGMYLPYLVAWIATALVVIVAYGVIVTLQIEILRTGRKPTPEELAVVQYASLFGYLLILLAWQFASPWYKKVMMRNIAGTLRFRGGGFRTGFTTAQLYWLKIPNFFMLLFHSGIGVSLHNSPDCEICGAAYLYWDGDRRNQSRERRRRRP